MAYRFQHRRDTEANWKGIILADGEIGMIQRNGKNTNLYKIGDGVTPFENLDLYGFNGTLSQTLEVTENEPVSNEAVSKSVLVTKFNSLDEALAKLSSKEELQALSKKVDDNKTEFDELSNLVDTQADTIGTIQSDIETLSGTITTQGESIDDIKDRLDIIENQHVVLSQTEYNNKSDMGELIEDVLYYVYEETE